jgi:hypothetical protein
MHDEAEARPVGTLLAVAIAIAVELAEAGRPGQGEDVEIEIARLAAPVVARLRHGLAEQARQQRQRECESQEVHRRRCPDQGRAILQSGA